jgi:hypothetical protein
MESSSFLPLPIDIRKGHRQGWIELVAPSRVLIINGLCPAPCPGCHSGLAARVIHAFFSPARRQVALGAPTYQRVRQRAFQSPLRICYPAVTHAPTYAGNPLIRLSEHIVSSYLLYRMSVPGGTSARALSAITILAERKTSDEAFTGQCLAKRTIGDDTILSRCRLKHPAGMGVGQDKNPCRYISPHLPLQRRRLQKFGTASENWAGTFLRNVGCHD